MSEGQNDPHQSREPKAAVAAAKLRSHAPIGKGGGSDARQVLKGCAVDDERTEIAHRDDAIDKNDSPERQYVK